MDWECYKRLCDQPDVFSRWMLEQTLELVGEHPVAAELSSALRCRPLGKPGDHRGGHATDMFVLALSPTQRQTILALVRTATNAGVLTSGTTERGLGGFVEAWLEYSNWNDYETQETQETQKGDSDE